MVRETKLGLIAGSFDERLYLISSAISSKDSLIISRLFCPLIKEARCM